MELPQDLFEDILQKLPVKSLLRLKLVSTHWKSTIESQYFKKRHLICRKSQDPDILIATPFEIKGLGGLPTEENTIRILMLDSLDVIKFPSLYPLRKSIRLNVADSRFIFFYHICGCDGMICYYNYVNRIYVVNPMTRWFRSIPQARFQPAFLKRPKLIQRIGGYTSTWNLGFGKEKFTDTYKLVWLYNSYELGLDNDTTCEVFDFSTNTWRYVTGAPIRILEKQSPVYLDGSLHWLTDENIKETRILSFDIHTEKFHIIAKTPSVDYADSERIIMYNLNNHLCVSTKQWPLLEIWSLNSDMIWTKMYSLDLEAWPFGFRNDPFFTTPSPAPIEVTKSNKSLVLYYYNNLGIFDPEFNFYDLCLVRQDYQTRAKETAVSYFPSLMSIN